MCPLRFILVFSSALLAGYLAWTTLRFSSELDTSSSDQSPSKARDLTLKKMIRNGFWVLVDMASGKYLWRNLKSFNTDIPVNGS